MELSPGDMLFNPKSSATGVLLERLEDEDKTWRFNLTSPSCADTSVMINDIYTIPEKIILDNIKKNVVLYYPIDKKEKGKTT